MEPLRIHTLNPLCPERAARCGTRPSISAPSHATIHSRPHLTGAVRLGPRVRALVGWALKQRELTLRHGWNGPNAAFLRRLMMPLQVWMDRNLHPSADTIKHFWAQYREALAIVMPGKTGRKKMDELERIVNAL